MPRARRASYNRAGLAHGSAMRARGARSLVVLLSLATVVAALPSARGEQGPPAWAYPVDPPGSKSPARRRHPAAGAGQRRGVHADPAARPVLRAGLASGRSPSHAPRRFAREEAGRVRLWDVPSRGRARAAPRTPASRVFRRPTSSSRWPTSRAAPARTSVPERLPPQLMSSLSVAATDAEVESAAAYFSALSRERSSGSSRRTPCRRTHVAGWHLRGRGRRRERAASADGSSRSRKTWSGSSVATRGPASSPTSRSAASGRARALAAGGGGRTVAVWNLPRARTSRGSGRSLESRGAHRATSSASSTTSSTAPERGPASALMKPAVEKLTARRHARARGLRSLPAAVSPGPGRSPQPSRQRETRPSSSSAPISRQSASRSPRRAPCHSRSSRLSARGTSVRSVASRR